MHVQKAVLVNESRLLRDLIKQVIEKSAGFEIAKELNDIQELSSAIKDTNSTWAFLVLTSTQEISDRQKVELLLEYPMLQIVALHVHEKQIELEWLTHIQKDITGMTSDELACLLKTESPLAQIKYGE